MTGSIFQDTSIKEKISLSQLPFISKDTQNVTQKKSLSNMKKIVFRMLVFSFLHLLEVSGNLRDMEIMEMSEKKVLHMKKDSCAFLLVGNSKSLQKNRDLQHNGSRITYWIRF